MRQVIDIENWKRKEEFLFFRTFQNPMVSVTVEVDCTLAYQRAKELGVPFSLYYMHAALVAANRIEELRYRQEGEEVVLYDRVNLFTLFLLPTGATGRCCCRWKTIWTFFLKRLCRLLSVPSGERDRLTKRKIITGILF